MRKVTCNIRCQTSIKHICECPCNGKNHGRLIVMACDDPNATAEPLETIQARLRKKAMPLPMPAAINPNQYDLFL
jgi:hypothetical protein